MIFLINFTQHTLVTTVHSLLCFEFYENISEENAKQFCKNCEACSKFSSAKKDPHIVPIISTEPFEQIQIDLKDFRSFSEWNDGICYTMSIVCHFSGLPWVHLLTTKESSLVQKNLAILFREMGTPKIVQFDNGGEFISTELLQFLTDLDIQVVHTSTISRKSRKMEPNSFNALSRRWNVSI